MMAIFGSGMTTGKYAMGSNEALGDPSDFMDNPKDDPSNESHEVSNKTNPQTKNAGSASKRDKKRKRFMFDEETLLLSGMTEAVNNVAAAIRETVVYEVHPDLYGAVMNMIGFVEDVLFAAFSYLVDNMAQGAAFVTMNENHRAMWLWSFCAKHNL